jgi:CRP-like cAMP-binding protein
VAIQETEAIVIDGAEFAQSVRTLPDWFSKISKILVQRLRDVDGKIDFSKGGDKTAHVAALVSLMSHSDQCTRSGESATFAQSFLENELVTILNMQDAEAAEALSTLARKNLIQIDKGKVAIVDAKGLDEIGNTVFRNADATVPT